MGELAALRAKILFDFFSRKGDAFVIDVHRVQDDNHASLRVAAADRAKRRNWLGMLVVENGEVFLLEPANWWAILMRDDDIQANRAGCTRRLFRLLSLHDVLRQDHSKERSHRQTNSATRLTHRSTSVRQVTRRKYDGRTRSMGTVALFSNHRSDPAGNLMDAAVGIDLQPIQTAIQQRRF